MVFENDVEDADGDVRTVETISHSLGGQLAEFDPKNTRPYSELDISTDATGKVTNVQFKLDNDTATRSTNGSLVDLSVIGQVFGSSIGRILAPDNQFGQLLGGTVGGLIGQKLAQILSLRSPSMPARGPTRILRASPGWTWRAPRRGRWPRS